MNEQITATNIDELKRIGSALHDRWFSLDSVQLDELENTVTVPFVEDELVLTVYGANNLIIRDTEKIGKYDFNKFEYDPGARNLRIMTGVPVQIDIVVDKMLVTVGPFSQVNVID